jgi:dolichol-phosphate mannosyltransferase
MILDKITSNFYSFSALAFFMVANTFMIGMVLIVLGMIAHYIGCIYTEVINRPLYVIRKIIDKNSKD